MTNKETRFKCNGYSGDSDLLIRQLTENQTALMAVALDSLRRKLRVELENDTGKSGYYEFGSRFSSDGANLLRILSQTTIDDMLKFPNEWAEAALLDSASTDHWYYHEKCWD